MKVVVTICVLFLAGVSTMKAQADGVVELRVGDMAPDFSLPYATRDSVGQDDLKLSSLFGRGAIVLAFYPADWSGGCTKEVCTFRDKF